MVAIVRPPSLPSPPLMSPLFGGLYAAAYGVGGQPLVRRLVQNYGPVIALPVLGYGRVVAVADPALAKQVFTAKPDVLLGGEGVGPAAAIYGRRSMFVLEEPEHLRRRAGAPIRPEGGWQYVVAPPPVRRRRSCRTIRRRARARRQGRWGR